MNTGTKYLLLKVFSLTFLPTFLQSQNFFHTKMHFFLDRKSFVAKLVEKNIIRESLWLQFCDFTFSRSFLPAKASAPKVVHNLM